MKVDLTPQYDHQNQVGNKLTRGDKSDYAKKDVDLSIIEEKENIELVKEGGAKGEKISIYNIFHDKFHHCLVIKLLLFSNESIIDIILLSNIYNSQP